MMRVSGVTIRSLSGRRMAISAVARIAPDGLRRSEVNATVRANLRLPASGQSIAILPKEIDNRASLVAESRLHRPVSLEAIVERDPGAVWIRTRGRGPQHVAELHGNISGDLHF